MNPNLFNENPFAQFSAEEEQEIIDTIFYEPPYYSSLVSTLTKNSSRFLLGQRGDGKSFIIYKLFNDLSQKRTLPILITRYDDIPLTNNENHFLYTILYNLTIEISKQLLKNPQKKRKLTRYQKGQFATILKLFYTTDFCNEFIDTAKSIKQIKSKNFIKKIYNCYVIHILNKIINTAINVGVDVISGSLGLPSTESVVEKNYLNSIELEDITKYSKEDIINLPKDKLVSILHILCDIAETIEYSSIVVLFDKIDEFQRINADVNKITDFCLEILTDTDLLLSNKISIVFSLWSEIKRSLNSRGVRFDKFSDIDVQLSDEGLVKLLNKRLSYFSNNIVTFESLIPYENSRKDILFVADKSPRTLIKLLSEIYICDFSNEKNSFDEKSISKGLILFCKKFDYESLLSKGRNDLISWINKLLRIRQHTFTIQMMLEPLALNSKNAQRYIIEMEKIGLIKLLDETAPDGQNVYKVEDHRIRYLISKGVISLDD